MKNYVKPTVAKVNFDFTDRVAASICSNVKDAAAHLFGHDFRGETFSDGCRLTDQGAVIAGNYFDGDELMGNRV